MYNTKDYCLENEVWKDIPGYEKLYEASSFGRIRSIEGKITYTEKHGIRHWKGRILKNKTKIPRKEGYKVDLWKNGKPKDWLVHRLVCMTFHGVPDFSKKGSNFITVNHIDCNRFNNNMENLEWMSLKNNIKDGFEKGCYRSTQKEICFIFEDGSAKIFESLSEASRYLSRNSGYMTSIIKSDRKLYDKDHKEIKFYLK